MILEVDHWLLLMMPPTVFTVEVSRSSWGFGLLSWGEFYKLVTQGRGFGNIGLGLRVDRSWGKGRKLSSYAA